MPSESAPPTVPFIPDHAPFSPEQRAWLNGFLAGVFSREPYAPPTGLPGPAVLNTLTILYGSQTGTAEALAKRAAKEAGKLGFAATILDMAQTDLARMAAEKSLLVIVSTYGDGEPPDAAKSLHAALAAEGTPSLAGVKYTVCALGDSNYTHFCQCGKDFDAQLERRGAVRAAPRADCDAGAEVTFLNWLKEALRAFAPVQAARPPIVASLAVAEPGPSRANPFSAPILGVRRLNSAGSAKEVNHIEISLAGSELSYEVGDALGVTPQNCPELVAEVLAALGCDGEEAVAAPDGSAVSLRRALCQHYCLGKPSAELLARLNPTAAGRTAPLDSREGFPHVIDALLGCADRQLSPEDFVRTLRKLQPRLYSISSSPQAHPGQVHVTVAAVRYDAGGRRRNGVCSTFLADRAMASGPLKIFMQPNPAFRLPPSGDTPIIMVGPGTRIAPFRAFLQARRAAGARGRSWLFFGDQHAATDFLYREELAQFQAEGVLTRLDLAFSRDQPEKIYVQHRMLENAAELFSWLEAGAHFYVCGDAKRMAKDVDAALHRVVEIASGGNAAAAYVRDLKTARRYARDVY